MITVVVIPINVHASPYEKQIPPESQTKEYLLALQQIVNGDIEAAYRWFPFTEGDKYWRNYCVYVNSDGQDLPMNDRLRMSGLPVRGQAVIIAEDNVCQEVKPWPMNYSPLKPATMLNFESIIQEISSWYST